MFLGYLEDNAGEIVFVRLLIETIFMLLSKCHPYCDFFGVELYQPIIANLGHYPI
ncbi:MAG: hypothetical protein ISS63_00620 [Desulfobacteraceae bacterium]|nr:hypothetical protein [Desulfobacteraceae bacterium]